ncbi:MAG: transcription termination factor Rho [Clostridia bacterium]|nr:transcription termination factor Rho [Clostridia bacterium]
MDYRSLHMKTVADLRQIAKEMELKIPARTSKAVLVEMILERQAARATEQAKAAPAQPEAAKEAAQETPAEVKSKRGRPRAAQGEKARSEKPARGRKSANAAEESPEAAEREKSARGRKRAAAQEDAPKPDEAAQKEAQKPESTVQKERAEAPAASAPASAAVEAAESQPKQERTEAIPAEVQPTAGEAASRTTVPAQEGRASYTRPMSTQQRMGARAQSGPGNYRPNQRPMGPANRPGNRYEGANPRPQRSYDAPQTGYRRPVGLPEESKPRYRKPVPGAEAGNPVGRYPQGAESGQIVPAQAPIRAEDASQEIKAAARPATPATVQATAASELNPAVPELLSSGECGDGAGILEIHSEGYGFLRAENYLPGNKDVYVSAAQIRRFNLRTGDYVVGKTRAQQMGDRSVGLIYINEVNGQTPDMARHRRPFDSLVPVYPDERLRLERPESKDISLRLIDMIAPIGKGQRGMIVSQPKAGKTTLLKKIANAITANNPDVHLIVLLIDERPEEVTDMKRSIQGEVVYSTFDEAPENHTRVSEMVLERAQRLVELGKDVVVLLDSITRLARAYNLVIPPTGRSLSGGLDPGALFKPKRFFGAARNIENGGSLTIIATALVDTGSRMDDIIFEEFKGTGNMELHLDRSLSDRRIFPAIDLYRSGTRREELLMDKEELDGVYQVRRMLSKGSPQEAAEQLISLMEKTATNREFFQKFKGWMSACEKDGFTMR